MLIHPDFKDKSTLEKYSSAFSLSDMEIFVFPDLLFPLVISNIMSPILWTWREDPWFKDIHKKTYNYKVNRIKQYIMDHFVFNLDLETWGMTQKDTEINRFKDFIDLDILRQSNALFGYEGDKYYFDIDIRRHFGLDKYTTETIPYWKTETLEAMTAFKLKDSFTTGAGECVSLSALYAAALFVVGRIPLESIFLIGTPLHSQNFIDFNEGLLTNNRRIVTKKMWFNGTAISSKARRALENEKVTIVSHLSGYIHYIYPDATIQPSAYDSFSEKLKKFLINELTPEVFLNFLRYHMVFKKCFQYRYVKNGKDQFIGLETIFEYEHSTRLNFSEGTRETLLNEIDEEEFSLTPLENRLVLQDIEQFLSINPGLPIDDIKAFLLDHAKSSKCNNEENISRLLHDLKEFLNVVPQLPAADKNFKTIEKLDIQNNQTREEIIDLIKTKASENEMALLSLYAYRQMDFISWEPFVKTAMERNPVSVTGWKDKSVEEVYQLLFQMPNDSIYDGVRLAQPDEVYNFNTGDGIEKAFVLAAYLRINLNVNSMKICINGPEVQLNLPDGQYTFTSSKNLVKEVVLQ